MRPQFKYVYILASVALVVLAFYRSVILDITNDEAYSFLLADTLNTDLTFRTANTHWLNSIFMFIEMRILGVQEWMLRLHSVAALAVSSVFLYKAFTQRFDSWYVFVPFLLLLGNHYLFDFFSLARGYALATMFTIIALYYILKNDPNYTLHIYGALALATFSTYTCIYLLYAYFLVDLVLAGYHKGLKHVLSKKYLLARWPFFIISMIALPNIYTIKYIGYDLEEGLPNGFIQDTIGVFVHHSIPTLDGAKATMISIALLTSFVALFLIVRKDLNQAFQSIVFSLVIVVVAIHVLFKLLYVPYPFGRTSFFFIVPFIYCYSYMLCVLMQQRMPSIKIPVVFTILAATIFMAFRYRSVYTTFEWYMQQGIRKAINQLATLEGSALKNKRIGMSIDHFGTYTNYLKHKWPQKSADSVLVYNARRGYNTESNEVLSKLREQDYLLMFDDYHPTLDTIVPPEKQQVIAYYPHMKTALIKVLK